MTVCQTIIIRVNLVHAVAHALPDAAAPRGHEPVHEPGLGPPKPGSAACGHKSDSGVVSARHPRRLAGAHTSNGAQPAARADAAAGPGRGRPRPRRGQDLEPGRPQLPRAAVGSADGPARSQPLLARGPEDAVHTILSGDLGARLHARHALRAGDHSHLRACVGTAIALASQGVGIAE